MKKLINKTYYLWIIIIAVACAIAECIIFMKFNNGEWGVKITERSLSITLGCTIVLIGVNYMLEKNRRKNRININENDKYQVRACKDLQSSPKKLI